MDIFTKIKAVVPHMWFQNGNGDIGNEAKDSFEVRKRDIRQSSFRNMLKKRFIVQRKVNVDDPRSPSCVFQRSPILRQNEIAPKNVPFSPFNVDEMLQTVQERLLISTPKKAQLKGDNSIDNVFADDFPDDDRIIGSIQADWNDFEFEQRDGSIPESLRVETSRCEQSSENLEEETNLINDENAQTEENNEKSKFPCKVVAVLEKNIANSPKRSPLQTKVSTPKTSTPVKNMIPIINKHLEKRTALTPLRNAAANSPAMKATLNTHNSLSKSDKQEMQGNEKLNGNKKTKINSQTRRRLPKAPSTPLTPLFKTQRPMICSVIQDQENL